MARRAALLLLGFGACEEPAAPAPAALSFEQVRLERPDGTLVQASAATAEPAGTGQAQAVVVRRPAGDAPALEITAPVTRWDLRAGTARFEGGVVARRGEVELRCAALDVRYDGPDRLERAVATGGVEVRAGSRVASGARAELETRSGEVVLTGDPRLRDGSHEMSGQRIVFLLDSEQVECQDCRLVVAGAAVAPLPTP